MRALFPFPIFPVSLTEEPLPLPRHPPPSPASQAGHPHLLGQPHGWQGGSELSGLEAYKQMQEGGSGMTGRGLAWKEAHTRGPLCEAATWRRRPAPWTGC